MKSLILLVALFIVLAGFLLSSIADNEVNTSVDASDNTNSVQ
jgi:hypothetical protein